MVFSTNKTDRHNITEILLKGVLNTLTLIFTQYFLLGLHLFKHFSLTICEILEIFMGFLTFLEGIFVWNARSFFPLFYVFH